MLREMGFPIGIEQFWSLSKTSDFSVVLLRPHCMLVSEECPIKTFAHSLTLTFPYRDFSKYGC